MKKRNTNNVKLVEVLLYRQKQRKKAFLGFGIFSILMNALSFLGGLYKVNINNSDIIYYLLALCFTFSVVGHFISTRYYGKEINMYKSFIVSFFTMLLFNMLLIYIYQRPPLYMYLVFPIIMACGYALDYMLKYIWNYIGDE